MNSPKKFTRNLVLVFSLLLVGSCGPDGSTVADDSMVADDSTVADESESLNSNNDDNASDEIANNNANFTATLLSGATFDSATVLQSQPLALWFWAPG